MEIAETREYIYARDYYKCQYPGCHVVGYDNLQLAYRIAQTKTNRDYVQRYIFDKYGVRLTKTDAMALLHHYDNLITSCAKHNSTFNIGNVPEERDRLIEIIFEDVTDV